VSYVVTNARSTGSATRVPAVNQFPPGIVPADYDQRNAFLNLRRDTAIPKHKVRWNWLIDLPFGKGKPLGRNAGAVPDKFIGGWQLAGIGSFRTNYFSLPAGNWNITSEKIRLYGYKYPIQDCRGGSGIPGYPWWNGCIPANQIDSVDKKGKPNGHAGVPAACKPAVTPLIRWPAAPDSKDPNYAYFGTNNIRIPLKNGTTQRAGFDTGPHRWRNQYLPGVRQWAQDVSLFRNIPIRESVNPRFAADFFNVFNHPNNTSTIGGDGFLNTRASGIAARMPQLSPRPDW